jgi:hypothetical protein
MTHLEKAIKSVEARGLPYYHGLNKQYPIHFSSFSRMHGRIWEFKLTTDFPRTYQGFKDFVEYLGDVPVGMIRPSVGRKDHSLGYVRGNFGWQELSSNSLESVIRNGFIKPIPNTPTHNKRKNLINFINTLTVDTLITDQLSKELSYNYTKDLVSAVKCLSKLKTINRKHYIVI